MIPVAEALARVTAGVRPVAAEQVALVDALGRVLAEDVAARLTHPPAAVSSMDGYAVRAADVATVPAKLTLIGESAAGAGFKGKLGARECVRIFTGAPLPEGADAVVIQEDADADGAAITMNESAKPGAWVRPAGLDFEAGQVLLKAGRALSARDVGLAAAMNVPWLKVRRRPRVAIIATGDEVVMPGDPLGPYQIVSSNSVALAAYVTALGGTPINLGIARDTAESLKALVAGVKGADLLVTSGGASVGDYDLIRSVLGKEGLDINFYKIAMRPGKPLIFGRLGETPMLGLPGNPVSAGVCSVIFLKPAMEVMLGIDRDARPAPTALLGCDLGANDKREDYLRAALSAESDGQLVATPFAKQDSSMMAFLAQADCLVVRPPFAPPIKKGERVRIVPLRHGLVSI
jgi:molybdopterin molybdotransferase